MSIIEDHLLSTLPKLKMGGKYWLAYSGGLDSHVLLQAMSKVSDAIHVIHINHGLSSNADTWQTHCKTVCKNLGVPFTAYKVEINQNQKASLETLAREARYAVFAKCLQHNDYLLMAHHQNDQIETMLYRLMRGTGPRGLSAIPTQRRLAKGQLLRPLLNYNRSALLSYAQQENLVWIEDESNQDAKFDRNFLRTKVLPLLKERWPHFERSWQRTSTLCRDADYLQTILGKQDLETVLGAENNQLCIDSLSLFEPVRQANILRVWLTELDKKYDLPMPDYRTIQRILDEVLGAGHDAEPLVSWSDNSCQVNIRRFNRQLYALKVEPEKSFEEDAAPLIWNLTGKLKLPGHTGFIVLEEVNENGIELPAEASLIIRFREGGEQAKPYGRKTRSLKKILPDYGVPPWLRDKVPLIYLEDELVAVADLFLCQKWQRKTGKKLYRFKWEKLDIYCGY